MAMQRNTPALNASARPTTSPEPWPTAQRHERAQRHRVKRPVQQDDEEHGQARRAAVLVIGRLGRHARAQRHAVDDAVQRQADEGARPRHLLFRQRRCGRAAVIVVALMTVALAVIMVMIMMVTVAAAVVVRRAGLSHRRAFRCDIVVMKAEEPFEEEHRQKADEDGNGDLLDRRFHQGVGHHVQEPDAEHETGDEADGDLHPPVGEVDPDRQPAADQRRQQDQPAIEEEQHPGRHQDTSGGAAK